jgi:uncharacterized protein
MKPGQFDGALDAVRRIYAELDARPVERDCRLRTECCHFKRTGLVPLLTRGEALLAARALRATGRKNLPVRPDGACPLLHPVTTRCLIYAERPFGCRTHFCAAAGGPCARRDVLDLIRKLEAVDTGHGNNDPSPLPDALRRVLREQTSAGRTGG